MVNEIESGQELNATQLDAQRARNLLDRALGMSERNDLAGALVTCRQSLALAPHSPQGWSMLGLLSERNGDIDGAIEAYEKALQLSPVSVYERESLQRLRHKRGAAPRPAPKFNFDEIGSESQISVTPASIPIIPQPVQTEIKTNPIIVETSPTFWDTFYFRSLPVLVAAVVCLGVILTAQRLAANRQMNNTPNVPLTPVTGDANTDAAAQPANPAITPNTNTLTPPNTPESKPAPAASPDKAATVPNQTAPPQSEQQTSQSKTEPKPKPAPKATVPREMPDLPRPKLTPPNRTVPTFATPSSSPNGSSSNTAPVNGGGPVDVGNSDDSKYIPINPPRFPNVSRD